MSKRSATSEKRARALTGSKGRAICKHPKKRIIFAQGDAADSVLYSVRKGQNHCRIRKADEFFGEDA